MKLLTSIKVLGALTVASANDFERRLYKPGGCAQFKEISECSMHMYPNKDSPCSATFDVEGTSYTEFRPCSWGKYGCLAHSGECSEVYPPLPTNIRLVAEAPLPFSAVTSFEKREAKTDLTATTFSAAGTDTISILKDVGKVFDGKKTPEFKTFAEGMNWPNQATRLEKGEIKGANKKAILGANGFFAKDGGNGDVAVYFKDGTSVTINKKEGWFYHVTELYDMDGDGLLDIVTARTMVPFRGRPFIEEAETELLWLKQPKSGVKTKEDGSIKKEWEETILVSNGPGVHFHLVHLDGDDSMQILATNFFAKQRLSIFYCDEKTWSDCSEERGNVNEVIVDEGEPSELRRYFSAELFDLNNDGSVDILATSSPHVQNGDGKVWAFEQPDGDWKTEPWTAHVISEGLYAIDSPPGKPNGSPGDAHAFFPYCDGKLRKMKGGCGKPHVLLSGDDAGFTLVLSPKSSESDDWTYAVEKIAETYVPPVPAPVNFAFGGATTNDANTFEVFAQYIPFVAGALTDLRERGFDVIGLDQQIAYAQESLAGKIDAELDLIWVYAGINNYFADVFSTFSKEQASTPEGQPLNFGNIIGSLYGSLPQVQAGAIGDLQGHLESLYDLGVRRFMIPNLPPFDLIPFLKNFGLGQFGLNYNAALAQVVAEFEDLHEEDGVEAIILDVHEVMLANNQSGAFNNQAFPCEDQDQTIVDLTAEGACEGFLFIDQYHPTSAAWTPVAELAAELLDDRDLEINRVITFGDSFSDIGRQSFVLGSGFPMPPAKNDRFADGPNVIDQLEDLIGSVPTTIFPVPSDAPTTPSVCTDSLLTAPQTPPGFTCELMFQAFSTGCGQMVQFAEDVVLPVNALCEKTCGICKCEDTFPPPGAPPTFTCQAMIDQFGGECGGTVDLTSIGFGELPMDEICPGTCDVEVCPGGGPPEPPACEGPNCYKGTMGSPSVADVNGDGYADIAVPFYTDGKIAFFTYAPRD